jgi:peptide/nickel transport system substrate-binding protein
VQFKLNQPFGPFLIALVRLYIVNADLVLAHIVKPGSYGDMGDYGNTWLLNNDAGSGLYKVKEFKQGSYLLMERFADFSGEHVQNVADKVTMYWNNEAATVLTMFQRRELEISDIGQSNESYVACDNVVGVDLANFLPGYGFYLTMHSQKPPTDDIYVRKAITLSIDYDTMINYVMRGSAPLAGPVPSVLPGHDPSILPMVQNMTAAMEALMQSQYYGQLDQYPIELHWCAEAAFEEKMADSIGASLQALGITISIVKTPWLTLVGEMATKESAPHTALIQTAPSYYEAGATLEARYSLGALGTWEQGEWLENATIDGMIADALSTVDQTERFQKYYAVQQQLMAMWPTAFLFDSGMTEAFQAAYIDFPIEDGIVLPMGYINDPRNISIYPELIPT